MKKLVCGLLIGFVLGVCGFAFASEFIVKKADFRVYVDGKEFTSETRPALTVNDTTYLSLVEMGKALNVPIKWNSEKRWVEVGHMPSELPQETGIIKVDGLNVKILGVTYNQGYPVFEVELYNASSDYIKYDLGRFACNDYPVLTTGAATSIPAAENPILKSGSLAPDQTLKGKITFYSDPNKPTDIYYVEYAGVKTLYQRKP